MGERHQFLEALEAEEDALASALGHQLNGLFIRIAATEIGEPVEVVLLANHHPADVFEARERDIESVVDEDDVAYVAERLYRGQLLFQHFEAGQGQRARTRRVVAERTRESATARRASLNRGSERFLREGAPVYVVGVKRIVFRDTLRVHELSVLDVGEVRDAAQLAARLQAFDDLREGRFALPVQNVDVRAHIIERGLQLAAMIVPHVVRDERPADDDLHLAVVLPDEFYHLVDRQVDDIEGRGDRHADRVLGQVLDQLLFLVLKEIDVARLMAVIVEEVRQVDGG